MTRTYLFPLATTVMMIAAACAPPDSARPKGSPEAPLARSTLTARSASEAAPSRTIACDTTPPNGKSPPPDQAYASGFNLGNNDGTIFTIPSPDGVVLFERGGPGFVFPDGSLSMKWPWYRTVAGHVVIGGRRIDAPSPPMPRITLRGPADGYGSVGFHPSALIFPTEGCWEVTATVSGHSLTFVTLVLKADDLPIPTAISADLSIQSEITRYGLYPIPASCSINPLSTRQNLYGFTGWYWLGDGLAAGTALGVLFEGENTIQWQYYDQAELAVHSHLLSDPAMDGQVSSMTTLRLPEYRGQVVDSSIIFPAPGCWQLSAQAADQVLEAVVYVYPRACRPHQLQATEATPSQTVPCRRP